MEACVGRLLLTVANGVCDAPAATAKSVVIILIYAPKEVSFRLDAANLLELSKSVRMRIDLRNFEIAVGKGSAVLPFACPGNSKLFVVGEFFVEAHCDRYVFEAVNH